MFRNNCYDRQNEINNTFIADNMDIDMDNYMNNMPNIEYMDNQTQPIVEPVKQRIVNRTIVHNVPHICPVETKIVNHHVYQHTYEPVYSCCEENVCSEVQCGSCSCFR